jgi:hypothetical protein
MVSGDLSLIVGNNITDASRDLIISVGNNIIHNADRSDMLTEIFGYGTHIGVDFQISVIVFRDGFTGCMDFICN